MKKKNLIVSAVVVAVMVTTMTAYAAEVHPQLEFKSKGRIEYHDGIGDGYAVFDAEDLQSIGHEIERLNEEMDEVNDTVARGKALVSDAIKETARGTTGTVTGNQFQALAAGITNVREEEYTKGFADGMNEGVSQGQTNATVSYEYHYHTDDEGTEINRERNAEKTGCFTVPVYHEHSGEDSHPGGCYGSAVYHTHTGSSSSGGGCYDTTVHTHTSACYVAAPLYARWTATSYIDTARFGPHQLPCPNCGRTMRTYDSWTDSDGTTIWYAYYCPGWDAGCKRYSIGCGLTAGAYPLICGKNASTIDKWALNCGKTESTVEYYSPDCGYVFGQIVKAIIEFE